MSARRAVFVVVASVLGVCLPLAAQQQNLEQLNARVQELFQEGRFSDAIPIAQESLRVAEATFGPDDAWAAFSLNNLARLYYELGRYAEAEPLYQRALRIDEKALGPDHPGVANLLSALAVNYVAQGEYAKAEPLHERARLILEKTEGPERQYLAFSLNNLAELYQLQGRYAEAEPLYQRAVRIEEKALGPDHPDVAKMLDNLALLYLRQGKYAEAEPLYRRAQLIVEKTLGPWHADVALSLMHLATLDYHEGKYAEAETLFQRALRIQEKALGPEHLAVAGSLNGLAVLYTRQGKYAEADSLYQRALRIRETTLGAEDPDVAESLSNLESLYEDQGKYAEAEPLAQRALRISEKTLGTEHPLVAALLNSLAVLYIRQGKYADAVPLLQRALRIQGKVLGSEHPDVTQSLNNLAALYYAQQAPHRAQPFFARGLDTLFSQFQYNFTYMSERERLGFLATVQNRFPAYFSFVHEFHQKMPELTGSMYDLLLWEKGFIAGSETALRRQVEASGDPEALKLLDQLAAERAQIANLLNAWPKDREAWRKQIEQLEAEANDLEKALVARSAAFAQQKNLERATWQQVRDALKPDEAAVEFARFRFYDGKQWTDTTYYVALVVTPETKNQPQYVVLGEGKALEGKGLAEFQQQVQARGMETATTALPGSQAYDLFWKPLEPLLVGMKRIYLSPDGVLNQMPVGLIPAPDGKPLMEKYDLRLVSSTKDLLRPAAVPAATTAVLAGNPTFDLGEDAYRAALGKLSAAPPPQSVQVAMLAPTDRSRDQGAGTALPPLPGTGTEIQAVDSLLKQHHWQATSYTGDRALEETVKQAHTPRLLHLATHGFFLPDQQIKAERMGLGGNQPSGLEDPMLRSGLFFAGADRALAGQPTPSDLDDGVLTAYEATGLNLQGTELVVLSACNTGQGDVKNGEGVFGLRRALQEAGAQAVMMSLWSVPDKETQELMTLFYSKWLSGVEKHEALRQAQLEEREVVRKRYGRDLPYYWGAFVLVGK
jgi:CHAT domain-containing protein/Flp pilus assembly protein TadD